VPDSPVPSTFRSSTVRAILPANVAPAYSAVPLGAALCFFGALLPAGFAWADGRETWPDEGWVLDGRRGQPLPAMNQPRMLVGATATDAPTTAGMVVEGGKYELPGILIPGSAFRNAYEVVPNVLSVEALDLSRRQEVSAMAKRPSVHTIHGQQMALHVPAREGGRR
jgi:hypothetical protein